MKVVQVFGAVYDTIRSYVGAARELFVDTSNWDLLIGDGTTPGGRRVLNQENSDARYQQKSDELDGMVFAPNQAGFVIRKSPGQYTIRTLTVNSGEFELTNAAGQIGNPLLSLKPTITVAHTWSALQTFSGGIAGNLTGDVTGDVTGDCFGNHTGTFTGPVDGDADGDHTGSFTGDVDVTGATLLLDDGQIPLAKLAGLDAQIALIGFPAGGIIAWYGTVIDIPAGWFLCDGTNATPDLRNRFIVGATDDYAIDDIGGTVDHTHTITVDDSGEHNHTITVADHVLTVAEMPAHRHGNGVCDNDDSVYNHGTITADPTTGESIDNNSNDGNLEGYTTYVGDGDGHNHTATAADNGTHTHTATNSTVSNLPPFYALCYIMKGFPA